MKRALDIFYALVGFCAIIVLAPVILVLGLTAMTLAWAGARISAALGDGE